MTETPFPSKENLCTRFATEVIPHRASTHSISTKIIPDQERNGTEKMRLEQFSGNIIDFSKLPNLRDEATTLMGLGDSNVGGRTRAFSRNVLSTEIADPSYSHLTLVDLSGLIHSENKAQTKEDVELSSAWSTTTSRRSGTSLWPSSAARMTAPMRYYWLSVVRSIQRQPYYWHLSQAGLSGARF
jgi:hypothetical protein